MTTNDLTRSLIYLNLYDMDGLIDIARTGVTPATMTPLKRELIQRLAIAIVEPIAPTIPLEQAPFEEFDDDDPSFFMQGRVVLSVYPLEQLKPLPQAKPITPAQARRANQ